MNFRVPMLYKKKTLTLAHEQEILFYMHGKYMRQFSCSTVKARKVETAKFDFSVLIYTDDSRGRRNVAPFSEGPGLEFMPRAWLSCWQIFSFLPHAFRHAEVLLHTAHWPVPATCLTLHTVILPRCLTQTFEKASLNELRREFHFQSIVF
jgi:hypothetical protein